MKNKPILNIHRFALAVTLLVVLVACSADISDKQADSKSKVVVSDKTRVQLDNIPLDDLALLSQGNTDFSLDLYQQLRSEPGNLFLSP